MGIFSTIWGRQSIRAWRAGRVQRESSPQRRETLDAVEFARQRLGFEPDAVQAELLGCADRQVIVNCTRQWGKSTVTAARAVWQAWRKPESLVLVVSASERQSGEFIRKARRFVAKAGMKVRGDGQNACSVMLPNGSRIVGIPSREDTVRGFSAVDLLIVDEAARVLDDLYDTVRPMLAVSGGATWLLSTPAGRRGFFYDEWKNGGEDWKRVTVKATECPRIPAAFLERERRKGPEQWFAQEYLCEFGEPPGALFPRELLEAALYKP